MEVKKALFRAIKMSKLKQREFEVYKDKTAKKTSYRKRIEMK